ncbi:aminoglycoside phosphotransferase family protein [Litoribrevibacter euphylliae]|uniref:Aminoglycoside phosphotransferase family protein n=1 Tax=Litoribrevibacter euphylliae TaxID=1834034 RepID=A0ABV7HAJ7_9GAMM
MTRHQSINEQEQLWLEESLACLSVKGTPEVEALTGDASARQYFRVKLSGRSFILCKSLDLDSNARFRRVSSALEHVGVMAPLVFAFDDELGLMLLSDLGNTLLIDVYQMNAHSQSYSVLHRVLNDLLRLSQISDELLIDDDSAGGRVRGSLASYDESLLNRDFGLFTEWCIGKALGLTLSDQEQTYLQALADGFEQAFAEQPWVWVHRDFHSRNLMLTDNDIGVIDFQDMVKGPICYDLISLIYDAYWQFPQQTKQTVAVDYYKLLTSEGLISVSEQAFQCWVAMTAMQRLIKVLGIFCRLALRDGKTGYLGDLPMVISHINEIHQTHTDALPSGWLTLWETKLIPALTVFLEK